MSVYNPNDPRDYLKIVKAVQKAKECGYKIEIKKFHPIQTDKQSSYLHFMISYLALKLGQTFYETLRDIQRNVCSYIFYTDEVDKTGNRIYKPLTSLNTAEASSVIRNVIDYANVRSIMIPEPDDQVGLQYCKRELENSGAGWV